MKTYRRINKIISKFLGTYFILFLSMWAIFLFTRCSNEQFEIGDMTPYHQYYSLDNTEYRIKDLSIDEFVSRFTALIQTDTAACYGKRKVQIGSAKNKKLVDVRIDSMSVKWSKLGRYKAEGKGPRCCEISIFLPNNDGVSNKYGDKYLFTFKVIDTSPVTLIIPRPLYGPESFLGLIFGNCHLDLSELIEVNRYNKYFREHYLDNNYQYDSLSIKNAFYVFILLMISTTKYLFILFCFVLIWIGIRILHRWSQS